jgi:hypothetical protein
MTAPLPSYSPQPAQKLKDVLPPPATYFMHPRFARASSCALGFVVQGAYPLEFE